MSKPKRGMLLGKFLPPHRGHEYLIEFARHYCDTLTVQVCSIASDPIPGELRYRWMREAFAGMAGVHVVHHTDPNPQTPEDSPDFWPIWRDSLLKYMDGELPDVVFASEDYGRPLADLFGAQFVPVDCERLHVPISGTALRGDVLRHWDYLLPAARSYFARRIAVVGPESSGKSTLTAWLASHFHTTYAAEYGRTFGDAVIPEGGQWSREMWKPEMLETIALGQRASVEARAGQCNRVVFSDTEATVTAIWSQILVGVVPPSVTEIIQSQHFDLYLLCSTTETWADDGQRFYPDWEDRKRFERECVRLMEENQCPYLTLSGTWEERQSQAVVAVNSVLGN